jgi:hypothetical protein
MVGHWVVVQRGPWPQPKARFSLPIADCRLTIEKVVLQLLPMCISNRQPAIGNHGPFWLRPWAALYHYRPLISVAISTRRNYTPGMVNKQRRVARYSTHLKASLSLPAEGTTFEVMVEDLSALGCLLEYAPWLKVRQECELAVAWEGREFRTPAVVIWKNVQGQAGLEFGSNDPARQAFLREICAKLRLKPLVRLPEDLE